MEMTTTSTYGALRAASIPAPRAHDIGLLSVDAYARFDGTGVGSAVRPVNSTVGARKSVPAMPRTDADAQGAPPRGRPV